jgi:superfamily I DNA/RNA helicase
MNKIREPIDSIVDEWELLPHWDKISKSKAEYQERQSNFEELRAASRSTFPRYSAYGPCMGGVTTRSNDDDPLDIPLTGTMGQEPLTMFLDDAVTTPSRQDATRRALEFDTVFLVGNEDGTFPTSQAIQEGEGSVTLEEVEEEERHLCHVVSCCHDTCQDQS